MKNGIYYTDGIFLLIVTDGDARATRDLATKIIIYKNNESEWEFLKDLFTHNQLLHLSHIKSLSEKGGIFFMLN